MTVTLFKSPLSLSGHIHGFVYSPARHFVRVFAEFVQILTSLIKRSRFPRKSWEKMGPTGKNISARVDSYFPGQDKVERVKKEKGESQKCQIISICSLALAVSLGLIDPRHKASFWRERTRWKTSFIALWRYQNCLFSSFFL